MFFKIGVLKNFTNFTVEICKIFKNILFYRTPPVAASARPNMDIYFPPLYRELN